MSERVRGFQKRRQRQADLARRRHLQPIADQALVAELLQDEGDDNLRLELEAARRAAYDIDASDSTSAEDAAALLMRVRAEFDEGRIEELTVSVRKSVLQSIVGPFGLGAVVAR